MKKIFYIPIVLSCLILAGCNTEDELKTDIIQDYVYDFDRGDPGSADFSNYVAVGNSLTAGFMDNALYTAGQNSSFPAILANQMLVAGGGSFSQPDINSADGLQVGVFAASGGSVTNAGRLVLDASIPAPVPIGDGDVVSLLTPYTGSLNNFGVPGARVVDLVSPLYGAPDGAAGPADGFPDGNPYYVRFASAPGTSTVLGDAAGAGASFFTLWIGSNDCLGWAATGGSQPDVTDDPTAITNTSALTDEANFNGALAAVVGTLRAGGAKGVIANLPDATFTPFFRAVAWNAIVFDESDPVDAGSIAALNGAYAAYNGALASAVGAGIITQAEADARNISFGNGGNGIIMVDEDLTDVATLSGGLIPIANWRQTTAEDLVPLSTATALQTAGVGTSVPASDAEILSKNEIALYQTRLAAFNATIAATAAADTDLALFDSHTLFLTIAVGGGILVDGVMLLPDFSPNGIFSVDGVHPNQRGYAIIANEFIKVINSNFGASVPEANVLNFPGVSLL